MGVRALKLQFMFFMYNFLMRVMAGLMWITIVKIKFYYL